MKLKLLFAGLLLGLSSAASAQGYDPAPLPAEQPALPLLAQSAAATNDADRLVLIDQALALLIQPTGFRGNVLCYKGIILGKLDQLVDARAAFDQCRQLRPDDPHVLVLLAFNASAQRRPVDGAQLLERALAMRADVADRVDPATMDSLIRQLRYARRGTLADELIGRLAATGYARLNAGTYADLALVAIRERVQHGDLAGAIALLPSIISPRVGVRLLVDRQYEPIWPAVAQWAGNDLSLQRDLLLQNGRAVFEAAPTPSNRVGYAMALKETGHRAAAIALLDAWLSDPAAAGADPWYRNSAAIKLGRWLGEEGHRTEGIARMAAAFRSTAGRDVSANNLVPNLVIEQLMAGDAAGALRTLDGHQPAPDTLETPAADGFFVALRACAEGMLGHQEEALAGLRRVETVYGSVDQAVTLAVACIAPIDEQAKVWLAQAENPDLRSTALMELASARYRAVQALPPESMTEAMLRHLADRTDVQQASARLGRELPASYLPALKDFSGPTQIKHAE